MSRKLVIMKRLTALLADTPVVYDYEDENGDPQTVTFDFSGRVFRGRKFIGDSEVPAGGALSIMESPRPSIGDGVGYNKVVRREDWTLNVQGFTTDDKTNPSDPAYLMAAAVEQRLTRIIQVNDSDPTTGMGGEPAYPDDYLLGRRIVDLTIAGSVVLPAQENLSRFAFFYTPLIVSLVKDARS